MDRLSVGALEELMSRAKAGDLGARNAIVEAYLPNGVRLGAKFRKRMAYVRDALMDAEDFIQAAWLGLVQAVDSFDPGRNADLDGWLGWCMRNAVIDAVREIYSDVKRRQRGFDFEHLAGGLGPAASVDRRDYIDWMETHLTDRQKTIVR